MPSFEALLFVLAVAVALRVLALRLGVPYPSLLALAGAALAFVPSGLRITIDPAVALALFVAPVLLDAAYDTSARDLKANWAPVLRMVVAAVGITAAAVALVAHWLVPQMPWAAAVALGAIVAPPDAAAAGVVLRAVRLPHRLTVILGGESLLNDASALLVYRLAVGAATTGGAVSFGSIVPVFLVSVVGSLVMGPLLALVLVRVVRRIEDPASSIILQFVTTFGVWILADALTLSPILTIVAYAVTAARTVASTSPARLRVPSYAVWDTAVLVLNALAFVVIGLELGEAIKGASPSVLAGWAGFGAAILATVIVVRLGWALLYQTLRPLWAARRGGEPDAAPGWRGGLAVGWCGMRGIVTVAAALALPERFPNRDLLLFAAYSVTLGTLVLQGLTLKPLLLALALRDDEPVEREVREARIVLAEVGIADLEGEDGVAAAMLRDEFEIERRAARGEDEPGSPASRTLRRRIVAAQRRRLLSLRHDGTIGDDAFHRLEEELDLDQLASERQR